MLSEPVTVRIANIRFLAGYRREWLVDQNVLADLRGRRTDLIGRSIGGVEESLAGYPHPLVRSALLSMLWSHEFEVNLDVRLEILARELRTNTVRRFALDEVGPSGRCHLLSDDLDVEIAEFSPQNTRHRFVRLCA